MLSRVANSICWMARYIERSNGMLRLLRTNYISSQDEVTDFTWKSVLKLYSDLPSHLTEQIERYTPRVLEHLLLDNNNTGSVHNNIYRARENARAVQDHITKELWQCLNDYYHLIRDQQIHNQILYGDPVSGLDLLIQQGLLYHGTVDNTMARGEGFNYLSIGKYLERAILSADMLHIRITEFDSQKQQSIEAPAWRYLLYSLAGYELYVKTYRGKFETEHVVQQVLYSNHFPHSVLYCLQELARCFERLKPQSLRESYDEVEFTIGKALNNVKYSNIKADREKLKIFLQKTRTEILQISNAFDKYYFGNS
jgi:uncharacterized alpha-E superfamily protein